MTREDRPPARSGRDTGAPAATAEEVNELLDRVRALRLTLTADLAAAASAIDAAQPAVARDIIDADSIEVQRLGVLTADPTAAPTPISQGRRRLLLALPAIPLVGALAITGAAAVTSGAHHRSGQLPPTHHVAVNTATHLPSGVHETAATTLLRLERVVATNRHQKKVVAVASHLHRQLSAIIATSPHSAAQLGEVRQLLAVEQRLLESHHGQGTAIALAASRKLTHLLSRAGLPTVSPTSLPTVAAKPSSSPATSPKPKHSATSSPHPSPKPTSIITAVPAPTASPTPHHHHHGHDNGITDPLLGTGLFGGAS